MKKKGIVNAKAITSKSQTKKFLNYTSSTGLVLSYGYDITIILHVDQPFYSVTF